MEGCIVRMFDTIECEEIKCFDNELKYYKVGDYVPVEEYGFEKDIIIMPFHTYLDIGDFNFKFIIIREGKVNELKSIRNLEEEDFKGIKQVITYMGYKTMIKEYNDLFSFMEEIQILKIKDNMNSLRGIFVDNFEDFEKKWFVKA